MSEKEARQLLESVERVIVCKGRATRELLSGEAGIDDLKGPTGKFRAPLLQADGALVVGFNRETLTGLFG